MAVKSVFISSTSSDLIDHRKAVRESLLHAGYHPRDMADFMARAGDATSACLDEVAESDLFVGIYAWRYGFIPPDSEKSITEQEFEWARQLEKPCFCFVVDENYDWPAQFKEEGKGGELLQDFKTRLDSMLVRTTFTTPDSLAKKVLSSLAPWEKSEHKLTIQAANQLIPGVSSVEEAQQMIASVLDAVEKPYEVDDLGCFNVGHGSTTLTMEVFFDSQLGLMVNFRAILAEDVAPDNVPAEVALDLLALNWNIPMGAIAFNPANGTIWYNYSIHVDMLTVDVAFRCMSFIADYADSIDDELAEWFG